jgi:hypothetical protein
MEGFEFSGAAGADDNLPSTFSFNRSRDGGELFAAGYWVFDWSDATIPVDSISPSTKMKAPPLKAPTRTVLTAAGAAGGEEAREATAGTTSSTAVPTAAAPQFTASIGSASVPLYVKGRGSFLDGTRFFLLNLPEFLDQPGEYFIHRDGEQVRREKVRREKERRENR